MIDSTGNQTTVTGADNSARSNARIADEPLVGEDLPRGTAVGHHNGFHAEQRSGVSYKPPQVRIFDFCVRREEDKVVRAVFRSDAHGSGPAPDAAGELHDVLRRRGVLGRLRWAGWLAVVGEVDAL